MEKDRQQYVIIKYQKHRNQIRTPKTKNKSLIISVDEQIV